MKTPKILSTLAALALAQGSLFAANTDPVGFVSVTALANSDVTLSVPMTRTAEFKGLISAISATTGTVTITVGPTSPNWTTTPSQQFAPGVTNGKTYAVKLATGAKEGLILPVVGNGTSTLIVTVNAADDLTDVLVGDSIDVMPYWSLGSLFSSLTATSSVEIQYYPTNSPGINSSPVLIYELAGTNWLNQDSGLNSNDIPLPFGTSYLARNNNPSPVTFTFLGAVPMSKHRSLLQNLSAGQQQDIRVGYTAPVPQTVGSIAIGQTPGDELHIYNNNVAGQNKSPTQILEYTVGGWLDQDSGLNVSTTLFLQPGQGYLLRRSASNSTTPYVWTALPSYLAP
ncbi:MAG: TIGR02597 family protein [Prosthecobacter sp.]